MTNQRRLRLMRAGGGALATCALGLLAPAARAADCSALTHVVYVAGSTASKVFVAAAAAELASESPPINVVYQGGGSCAVGVASQSSTPVTLMGQGVTFSGTPTAPIEGACDLDSVGTPVDVGVSDVYAKTCGATLGTGVADHAGGPVQSMNMVVLKDSVQQAISYDAAFLAFGLGINAGGGVAWNDPSLMEVRDAGSGTQQMISTAIDLPAAKWFGNKNSGAGAVVTALNGHAAVKDKAIGIISSSDADKNRASLRILAYQHKDQTCGFTPDSDSTTAFDKANVRDGHYAIWGPLHFYAKSSASADTKKLLDILTGKVLPQFDLIKLEVQAAVVPDCAMRVSRSAEVGPMASYMPAQSCECKYLAEVGTPPASCHSCTGDSDCSGSTPKCNFKYCEAQ